MITHSEKECLRSLSPEAYYKLVQIGEVINIDPNSALIKQRQYVEYLITLINKYENIDFKDITLSSKIKTLVDANIIDNITFYTFDKVRFLGNEAVHNYFSDITYAKLLHNELWQVSLTVILKYFKHENNIIIDNSSQVLQKTISSVKPFFIYSTSTGFKYEFSHVKLSEYTNSQVPSDLCKDVFESEKEYCDRLSNLHMYPIGLVKITNLEENMNFPIMAQLDISLKINYPTIEGFYINTSKKLLRGTYKLLSKLIYHNSKLYIDINNTYIKYNNDLIKVKLLVLSMQEFESNVEYTNRINIFGDIVIGTVSPIRESYNINTCELNVSLRVIDSFKHIIDNYTQANLTADRDTARDFCKLSNEYLLFSRLTIEDNIPIMKEYYTMYKKNKIEIFVRLRKNLAVCSAKVKLNEQWGFIDSIGNLIVKPQYIEIDNFYEDMLRVNSGSNWGYVNKLGQEVIKPQYEEAWNFFNERAIVKKDCKYYAIDKNNRIINLEAYDDMLSFSENLCVIARKRKYGFIDIDGNEVIPCSYENARNFKNGYAPVQVNDRWGYINKYNDFIIKPEFDYCGTWQGNYSIVEFKNKYGCIGINSSFIIPPIYENLMVFNKNLFFAQKSGKYGIINTNGDIILNFDYNCTSRPTNKFSVIEKDFKYGIINENGSLIVDCIYDHIGQFSEELCVVYKDNKCGFINKNGIMVIPMVFDHAYQFSEGLSAVQLEGKYGYINNRGEVVIPFRFDRALPFSNGLAPIQINYLWGFINKSGHETIRCKFESVGYFY